MTKVTYIHGIPRPPADEWKDRGREVKKPLFLNYGIMTDGEMKLALIQEQTRILESFYPEVKELKEASQLFEKALKDGLHDISYLPGYGAGWARQAVKASTKMMRPAAGFFTVRRQNGLGGLIPLEDCQKYMREVYNDYAQYDQVSYETTGESILCEEKNKEIRMLNEHLEPSSHHLLYEYLERPGAAPGVVAAKYALQRNAVSSLSSLLEFNRDNMRLWLRNGVMRNNARFGAEPFQPELTIDILRTEVPLAEGMKRDSLSNSVSAPFTLAALAIVIKAIAAAVAATVGLIAAMKAAKAQQLRNTAQGIGNRTFGPEDLDWMVNLPPGNQPPGPQPPGSQNWQDPGSGSGNGEENGLLGGNAAPLIIGAGLLLLATSK